MTPREEALSEWLEQNYAVCIAEYSGRHEGQTPTRIEFWHVRGKVLALVRYGGEGAWNVLIPLTDSPSVSETLAAMDRYVGGAP